MNPLTILAIGAFATSFLLPDTHMLSRYDEDFVLAEAFDHPIDHAYYLCPYRGGPDELDRYLLGPRLFDVHSWEHNTGIGITFTDGSAPYVEYFEADMLEVTNCQNPSVTYEFDPLAPAAVGDGTITLREGAP